ncbi:type II secretion system protein N [Maricaulis sp.]|uniref:type II secretion system protein N n=1 Tax=Maricaulis sp. TaxID=1486257 RepID=UPI0025BDCB25|nr:type II secretion system protein N [Maricaulis sp.]
MLARTGLVLALLVVWLIVLLPLKAVALAAGGSAALGYRDVFGTIWQGRVYGLNLNGVPVRELEVSLDPFALATGRLSGDWRIADASLRGDGRVSLSPGRLHLIDTDLDLSLATLGVPLPPGVRPTERIRTRIVELDMRDGACIAASGSASSGALTGLALVEGHTLPVLHGDWRCDGDRLVLDWSGEVDGLTAGGQVRFRADGYDWTARIETDWPDMADALALAGMRRDGSAWQAEGQESYAGVGG